MEPVCPQAGLLRKLVYFLAPPSGVLVTLATGFLANNYYSYGFPLPWKTLVASGICPPEPWLQIAACYLRLATSYNWAFFALDALFYTGIGYGLLLPANFRKFLMSEVRNLWSMLSGSLRVRLKWRELAQPFRATALIGIVGGIYLTSTSTWLAIVSSFFSGFQTPPTSGPFIIVSVAALAVYVAVPAISIGGAVSLLTLLMNDDQRGILSLFVTICSFLPMVYLGLEIFAWILQEWQFAIITIFWSILLVMTTRIVRSRPRASR